VEESLQINKHHSILIFSLDIHNLPFSKWNILYSQRYQSILESMHSKNYSISLKQPVHEIVVLVAGVGESWRDGDRELNLLLTLVLCTGHMFLLHHFEMKSIMNLDVFVAFFDIQSLILNTRIGYRLWYVI
jgi:hypothetical protein